MIYRFELFFRTLRRWLSRSEWVVRFLRLPVSRETATAPCLVLIQIDGLSYRQLESALQDGRMGLESIPRQSRFRVDSADNSRPCGSASSPSRSGSSSAGMALHPRGAAGDMKTEVDPQALPIPPLS